MVITNSGKNVVLLLAALAGVSGQGTAPGPSPGAPHVASPPPIPAIAPREAWRRFLVLVWQYRTDAARDLDLYEKAGFRGFHIDHGAKAAEQVAFARKLDLPYYVDHAAGKGYLHLTPETGRDDILGRRHVVPRPHSLADPQTFEKLQSLLATNVGVTREGPVVAYALDDEPSLGSFNSPAEVDGSEPSVAGYRKWLEGTYATIDALNASWSTGYESFGEIRPSSFEDLRSGHGSPPFSTWNLGPWMDWRSYMDTQFAAALARLVAFTNSLDPATPAGIAGGQQPAPYGGFDYAKLALSLQWMESYDIGGTCEILRSLWSRERRPYLQTWFSTGDARRDAWFLWYYLLHGCRGVIAWPEKWGDSWFQRDGERGLKPFIERNAETIREVQGDLSRAILDPAVRFDPDPIALLLSHPSVQASWVMDVVTHGGGWPNRSSGIDNDNQSAACNRVAWMKLLEDLGFQYDVVTGPQVAAGALVERGYRVLVLARAIALSGAEAAAIRSFVAAGGTVIADHLTGLLDEHGKGRKAGALDDLFGIRRDEAKGYLDGASITEIDAELYERPFLDRLRAYEGALRHRGIVVYERGTKAVKGVGAASAGGADVLIERNEGAGRAVYLNLTPLAYRDPAERLGSFGAAWREILSDGLARSGLEPRARVLLEGRPVPMAEILYWRRGDRLVVGVVNNPVRKATITSPGAIHDVTGPPLRIEIHFREPVRNVKDLRTGETLPDGQVIRARWRPWEGLVYEVDA